MRKDTKLNKMVKEGVNVAQFISIDKDEPNQIKYANIKNYIGQNNMVLEDTIKLLIKSSPSKSVNIRSFGDEITKGNKFVMGKTINDIDEILEIVKSNAEEDRHSIINENIDISDGGVSGVILGNTIEFSPNDTPRCVEKEGVCSLPLEIGKKILKTVYGFELKNPFSKSTRVEFSIHPLRQGVYEEHTIIWEYEEVKNYKDSEQTNINFPNNFSKFLGDKVFGILLAHTLGIDIPHSTIIGRNLAPFSFGKDTNSHEKWIRTAPINKEAGLYFTGKGWTDPFKLINQEEQLGSKEVNIASIISQQSVNASYSGAGIIKSTSQDDVIEGVCGNGDDFMLGSEESKELPNDILIKVKDRFNELREVRQSLGDFSVEWVYDGVKVWVVQLNQVTQNSRNNIIVEGKENTEYIDFNVNKGLNELRKMIKDIDRNKKGIKLIGSVGITSHFGDLLRLNKIPSYINK